MASGLQIKVDFKQLNKFIKLSRSQAIGVVKRSIRATVNDQAWSTQKQAKFKEIPKSMITRGKFNQSQVRVTTARNRSLTSYVGSKSGNYDGLANIELGKSESNKAIPLVETKRKGNKRRKIGKSQRLNSIPMRTISNSKSLYALSNEGYKNNFSIKNKFSKLNIGIYKFVGKPSITKKGFKRRQIELQYTTKQSKTTAKRNKWLYRSTKSASNPALNNRYWLRNQKRFLKSALDRALR